VRNPFAKCAAGENPARARTVVAALPALVAGLALLTACDTPAPSDPIDAAVANPDRPATDRDRDLNRKPAEVMRFFDVRPGMTVLEMFSGGGYYVEVLARIVGPEGKVYAHNNSAHRRFLADAIALRFRDQRLANVIRLDTEAEDIQLAPASLDGVFVVLAYHDVYVRPDQNWPAIDRAAMLHAIFDALKPGATLGVVDHIARPGDDPAEIATALHRIDEGVVIRDIEQAGFVLEDRSGILRNPADDYQKRVFDPQIRGRTDRFVLRFRKPL
jgi:predicted methyltransferase